MEPASPVARVHLRIEGRVQGVFFRASTVQQAQRLGLTGWVRNSPDGSVEVLAEGPYATVESLVAWCRQGPPGAKVTNVDLRWEQPRQEFSTFSIKR
jgi:acylphosphatase